MRGQPCGQPRHDTRPHTRWPHSFLGINGWMTSQLNVALIRKLHGFVLSLDYIFDMLSKGFVQRGTGRHSVEWYLQELNVCHSFERVYLLHTRQLPRGLSITV